MKKEIKLQCIQAGVSAKEVEFYSNMLKALYGKELKNNNKK